MSMFNLLEFNRNNSKATGSLWHYYRDEANNSKTDLEPIKF